MTENKLDKLAKLLDDNMIPYQKAHHGEDQLFIPSIEANVCLGYVVYTDIGFQWFSKSEESRHKGYNFFNFEKIIGETEKAALSRILNEIWPGRKTSSETKSDFTKNDSGKLQWSLLPFEQLEDVVRVLMAGAKKYSRDNWKKCDDINRYKDSLMRHVTAYIEGNKFDNEPGGDNLHHLAHAICNCLFILFFDKGDIEEWNRQLNEKMSV